MDKTTNTYTISPQITFGKFFNYGKIFIRPYYFLIPNSRMKKFVYKLKNMDYKYVLCQWEI